MGCENEQQLDPTSLKASSLDAWTLRPSGSTRDSTETREKAKTWRTGALRQKTFVTWECENKKMDKDLSGNS
jgi:hypothetical protein